MGLVYLPTWMVDFLWFSCRWIYQSHGSYGLRYGYSKGIKHVPFLVFCVLQRFQERTHGLQISKFQSSIWFFVCRKCMTTRHQQKKVDNFNQLSRTGPFPLSFPQKKLPDLTWFSKRGLEDLWLELRPRCQVGVSQENRPDVKVDRSGLSGVSGRQVLLVVTVARGRFKGRVGYGVWSNCSDLKPRVLWPLKGW